MCAVFVAARLWIHPSTLSCHFSLSLSLPICTFLSFHTMIKWDYITVAGGGGVVCLLCPRAPFEKRINTRHQSPCAVSSMLAIIVWFILLSSIIKPLSTMASRHCLTHPHGLVTWHSVKFHPSGNLVTLHWPAFHQKPCPFNICQMGETCFDKRARLDQGCCLFTECLQNCLQRDVRSKVFIATDYFC